MPPAAGHADRGRGQRCTAGSEGARGSPPLERWAAAGWWVGAPSAVAARAVRRSGRGRPRLSVARQQRGATVAAGPAAACG